jgi:acylphosphatase
LSEKTKVPVAKRVLYTGRVQGVGFRYTVLNLSKNFKLAGTVRNCIDGSVELIAQGEPDQVEGFLAAIAKHMGDYIADQNVQDAMIADLQGFHIIR